MLFYLFSSIEIRKGVREKGTKREKENELKH